MVILEERNNAQFESKWGTKTIFGNKEYKKTFFWGGGGGEGVTLQFISGEQGNKKIPARQY